MNDKPDPYEGFVGRELYINTLGSGKVAVTLNVKEILVGDQTRDELAFVMAATLFKHLFKPHFSAHDVSEQDVHVILELPENMLTDEWQMYLRESTQEAGKFRLETGPADESSRLVPRIVEVSDETNDETNED